MPVGAHRRFRGRHRRRGRPHLPARLLLCRPTTPCRHRYQQALQHLGHAGGHRALCVVRLHGEALRCRGRRLRPGRFGHRREPGASGRRHRADRGDARGAASGGVPRVPFQEPRPFRRASSASAPGPGRHGPHRFGGGRVRRVLRAGDGHHPHAAARRDAVFRLCIFRKQGTEFIAFSVGKMFFDKL